MADDFEKAVLISFDQSGASPPELRAQAAALLQSAAASGDVWQLCLGRLETSAYAEVRFWCLQTLHGLVRSPAYAALDPGGRAAVKGTLLSLGTAPDAGLPPFLRNKIAQTVVAVAAQEYPGEWPSFFQDVLGTLGGGPAAVDLFCRILTAVDEDIVSLEVPRSAAEARQSMSFKDAMRDGALGDVAAAWAQLVATYAEPAPELAAAVLEAVQRYVHWIDIGLVANDRFLPRLFGVLGGGAPAPRAAAAGVLTEIIGKRMEPLAKLALVQSLGVVPECARWATGLPGAGEDADIAARYAKLLAVLATEVLEAWKKVENSVLSMAAVGLAVGEEAGAEAEGACAAAAQMLDALFPAVLAALRCGEEDAADAVVPFLLAYIGRVRLLAKRGGGAVPPGAAVQLPAILEAAAACARFPDDSAAYAVAPADAGERAAAEEEEAALAERRQELFTLVKNTAKLCPGEACALAGRLAGAALPRADAPWQDAELALSLVFHLGEVAPEEALKPGTGPLAALAAEVIRSQVPAAAHRLVALALLETAARYVKVVGQQAGELLEPAISLFLGPSGLGHPSPAVPPRAAFLACRVVKALRQQLAPVAGGLLVSLQPHLAAIAASPLAPPAGAAPAKAAGASSNRGALGTGVSAADDRLYAFEAAGLLIGLESLPQGQQLEWMGGVLAPLAAQLEGYSGAAPAAVAPQMLGQALDALTRASKGFSARLCEGRPEAAAALAAPLRPALAALRRFPAHKPLRAKFMAYVHRLTECLGPAAPPHLAPVLWALHESGGDAADAADPLTLLAQVVTKGQSQGGAKSQELVSLVATALPDAVAKVHSFLGADWDWSGGAAQPAMASSPAAARLCGPAPAGSTEDLRERGELQRAYYAFLTNLIAAEMGGMLVGARGDPAAAAALNDLLLGAATHVDPSVRKLCVSALGKLATDCLGAPPAGGAGGGGQGGAGTPDRKAKPPGAAGVPSSPPIGVPPGGGAAASSLEEFFVQRFGCDVLIGGLAAPDSTIDVRDASAIALLTEVAAQLKAMHRLAPAPFAAHLCGATLPKLGWPAAAQEQLLAHIAGGEPKALKDFLKQAVIQLRLPGGGAGAATGVPVMLGGPARR